MSDGPHDKLRALVAKWRADNSTVHRISTVSGIATLQCASELADALAALDASRPEPREIIADLAAMCQSAATWPEDDIQGLRYHALEAAKRGRAALDASREPPRDGLLAKLQETTIRCCDCGRGFHCNRCPDCAGKYRHERAEGYKADAAAWRERALKAEARWVAEQLSPPTAASLVSQEAAPRELPVQDDADIPLETRRELMHCATSNGRISYYYLCDIWRRGRRALASSPAPQLTTDQELTDSTRGHTTGSQRDARTAGKGEGL